MGMAQTLFCYRHCGGEIAGLQISLKRRTKSDTLNSAD
jgi:hypothetical protein